MMNTDPNQILSELQGSIMEVLRVNEVVYRIQGSGETNLSDIHPLAIYLEPNDDDDPGWMERLEFEIDDRAPNEIEFRQTSESYHYPEQLPILVENIKGYLDSKREMR